MTDPLLLLVTAVVLVCVISVVLWAARALLTAYAVPQPVATSVYVLIVVLLAIWALQYLGVPLHRWPR